MRREIRLGWIFLVLWGVSVGVFDGAVLWSLSRQIHAGWTWSIVTGSVTSGRIVSTRSKRGTTYRPEIAYSYRVGAQDFVSTDVEVASLGGSSKKRAERLLATFPAGSNPPVFIDPNNPGRSALIVGPQVPTLQMVLFLIPFNAVLIGGVAFLLRAARYVDAPMKKWILRDDGNRAVLRITQCSPETLGLLCAGILGFAGVFVLQFAFGRDPSLGATALVLASVILAGFFAFAWRSIAVSSGRFDIEIDRVLRRVTVPRGRGALEEPGIRFDDLEVQIEEDAYRRVDRGHAWKLKLGKRGKAPQYTGLWIQDTEAKRIGVWICRQCGVPLKERDADHE